MTTTTCATGCGRPTHDTLMLCVTCAWGLQCDLGDIPAELAALNVTLRKKAVTGAANAGGSAGHAESRMPLHPGAYEARLALEAQLVGWVRDLAEMHGDTQLPGATMDEMSRWLIARMYRIKTHPAAADIHEEITTSMARIRALILGPAERVFVGVCEVDGCPGWLHAAVGAKGVTCPECQTVHPVEESRERLLDRMADRLMTMPEIAGMATHYGIGRRRAMKLMGVWVERGRIESKAHAVDGKPMFPFGLVLDMLRNTPVRARKAG